MALGKCGDARVAETDQDDLAVSRETVIRHCIPGLLLLQPLPSLPGARLREREPDRGPRPRQAIQQAQQLVRPWSQNSCLGELVRGSLDRDVQRKILHGHPLPFGAEEEDPGGANVSAPAGGQR